MTNISLYFAAVSCSFSPYDSGAAGLGFWLTGKLGCAWGGAWHGAWVVHGSVLIYKDLAMVYTNDNWFVILLSHVHFGD